MAVITLHSPPLTHIGHMSIKILPSNIHVTTFVGAGDKFEKARCQVNLLHKLPYTSVKGSLNGFGSLTLSLHTSQVAHQAAAYLRFL